MQTKQFWLDAGERALKTVAQAILSCVLLVTAVEPTGLTDIDWVGAVSIGLVAGIVSLLTSVVSSTVNNNESASLLK